MFLEHGENLLKLSVGFYRYLGCNAFGGLRHCRVQVFMLKAMGEMWMAVTARHLDRGWSVGVGWVDLVGWLFLYDVSAVFVVWLSLRLCQSMFASFFWLLFGVFFSRLVCSGTGCFMLPTQALDHQLMGAPWSPRKYSPQELGFGCYFVCLGGLKNALSKPRMAQVGDTNCKCEITCRDGYAPGSQQIALWIGHNDQLLTTTWVCQAKITCNRQRYLLSNYQRCC